MLSKSVLLYRTAFISVAANNTGGSYVTQVVSQCLLGTTGLGEISIYGAEGSLLTLWGWKQISCLYLKSCCSIATGCIKKPWTLLINSGERSLPAVLTFLFSISFWMHLLDSSDGKNNHGLLHFYGPSFMVLCRELHEKGFLNLYIWRYFLEGWKADILVPNILLSSLVDTWMYCWDLENGGWLYRGVWTFFLGLGATTTHQSIPVQWILLTPC